MKPTLINHLLRLTAPVLLLLYVSSCSGVYNKPEDGNGMTPADNPKATTYVSLALAMPSSLRADADGREHAAGTYAGQDLIRSIDVWMSSEEEGNLTHVLGLTGLSLTFNGATATGEFYRLDPIQVAPGTKKIYVVLNNTGVIQRNLNALAAYDAVHNFESGYGGWFNYVPQEAYPGGTGAPAGQHNVIYFDSNLNPRPGYSGAVDPQYASMTKTLSAQGQNQDCIVMTGNTHGFVQIKDNVTQEQAQNGTTSDDNVIQIEVRRLFPRVIAFYDQGSVATTAAAPGALRGIDPNGYTARINIPLGSSTVQLAEIAWTPMQYERAVNPGDLFGLGGNRFKSPHHEYIPAAYAGSPTDRYRRNAIYTYERSKQESTWLFMHPGNITTDASDATDGYPKFLEKMPFITETTHPFGTGGADTGYRVGNTAYILVRALMLPASDLWKDNAEYTTYQADLQDDGQTTRVLYYSIPDAKFCLDPGTLTPDADGRDKYIEYKNGYCYYYAWIHPNTDVPSTWFAAPVWRNSIYFVKFTKFTSVGFAADPIDPNVTPDPDDRNPVDEAKAPWYKPYPDPLAPITLTTHSSAPAGRVVTQVQTLRSPSPASLPGHAVR